MYWIDRIGVARREKEKGIRIRHATCNKALKAQAQHRQRRREGQSDSAWTKENLRPARFFGHLVKDSEGLRIRRAALGLRLLLRLLLPPPSRRATLAVDAADPDPAGGDLLRDAPDGGPLGDVGGGGGEQLELGPHEAHQGGQVLVIGGGVEEEGPAAALGGGSSSSSSSSRGSSSRGKRRRRRHRVQFDQTLSESDFKVRLCTVR